MTHLKKSLKVDGYEADAADEFFSDGCPWSQDGPELANLVKRLGPANRNLRAEMFIKSFFHHLDLSGREIDNIDRGVMLFSNLQHLDLSRNQLSDISVALPNTLEVLFLDSNNMQLLTTPTALPNLRHLSLSFNSIYEEGIASIVHRCPELWSLDLSYNVISDLTSTLSLLRNLPELKHLYLLGNPCCLHPKYRQVVLSVLPQLMLLDDIPVKEADICHFQAEKAMALSDTPVDSRFKLHVSSSTALEALVRQHLISQKPVKVPKEDNSNEENDNQEEDGMKEVEDAGVEDQLQELLANGGSFELHLERQPVAMNEPSSAFASFAHDAAGPDGSYEDLFKEFGVHTQGEGEENAQNYQTAAVVLRNWLWHGTFAQVYWSVPQEPIEPEEAAEGEEPAEPVQPEPIRTLLGGGQLQLPTLISGNISEANVVVKLAPADRIDDAGIRVPLATKSKEDYVFQIFHLPLGCIPKAILEHSVMSSQWLLVRSTL